MKITIVTISYNQSKYLKQCIDSVLSQKNVELEYIVVDPGSTDGSREIINSYGDQIIKLFDLDDGPADGLNKGFKIATGDIFGFLNSDDYLSENSLERIIHYYKNNEIESFITGHGWIKDEINNKTYRVWPSRITKKRYAYEVSRVFQQGTFFPAKLFLECGGFNKNNMTCWDGELFAKLANDGYVNKIIEDDIAVFRIHSESISGSNTKKNKYIEERNRIFKFLIGRDKNLYDRTLINVIRPYYYLIDRLKTVRKIING